LGDNDKVLKNLQKAAELGHKKARQIINEVNKLKK